MGWYLNKNCKNNHSGDNQQTKHSGVMLARLCLKIASTEKKIFLLITSLKCVKTQIVRLEPLARLSLVLDTESKFMIFNAFVVSNFLYCPFVWHMC